MAHSWFYNEVSGLLTHQTNPLLAASLDHTPSWRGFDTQAAAQAYKKAHPPAFAPLGDAASAVASGPVKLEQFLGALTERSTWIRAAEIIIGAALIIVGLVQLAPPGVKDAAKVAALL